MASHELGDWETPTHPPNKRSNPLSKIVLPARWKSLFRTNKPPPFSAQAIDSEFKGANTIASAEDEVVPARRTIFGQSRRRMALIAVLVLALIVLIIGLAVGLKKKSSKSNTPKNLPLPSNTATFNGDLTYYSPGPGYGACGYQNTSTEAICAVSHYLWDSLQTSSNSNNNPLCGKMIRITRYDASKGGNSSVDVEVVDRCVGCEPTDLDLSLKMFTSLADESLGRVIGSWAWLNGGP